MATKLLQRAAVGKPLDHNPTEALSNRELQVFEMIGQGMSTVEIAGKLQVSPKTVESHRKVIKTKLNVRTSSQLSRRRINGFKTTCDRSADIRIGSGRALRCKGSSGFRCKPCVRLCS